MATDNNGKPRQAKNIVILIHGIRTRGLWQNRVAQQLGDDETDVISANYGRFGLVPFLLPTQYFRRRAAERVWAQIQQRLLSRYFYEKVDINVYVIAHSFGTYILGHILRRETGLRISRVVLCGNIMRSNADIPALLHYEHGESPNAIKVLSEVSTDDPWPIVASKVTLGYGPYGTTGGFQAPAIVERMHVGMGHSGLLQHSEITKSWKEFLLQGTWPQYVAQRGPLWIRLLYLSWVLPVAAILAVGIGLASALPERSLVVMAAVPAAAGDEGLIDFLQIALDFRFTPGVRAGVSERGVSPIDRVEAIRAGLIEDGYLGVVWRVPLALNPENAGIELNEAQVTALMDLNTQDGFVVDYANRARRLVISGFSKTQVAGWGTTVVLEIALDMGVPTTDQAIKPVESVQPVEMPQAVGVAWEGLPGDRPGDENIPRTVN